MDWQDILGSSILIPQQEPIGIVHFLGGAFVGTLPNLSYRWLLEQLGKEGYVIIATPFLNTFDHTTIARDVLNRFETILERLQSNRTIARAYLPIYGIGHSMGCKLHLLIGSLFNVDRAGNILVSFNNYPASRAIPFGEQLKIDRTLNLEFKPTPRETNELILKSYQTRRNLLIRFDNDDIDQTAGLNPILQQRFPEMISILTLPGNHLTPLSQDLNWQPGEIFTPLDAIGQWLKQELSRDLYRLNQEILRWLNPLAIK
ncbi:MAG: DUF1350 family protein [Prochloraceae cyanobacterium]|nr:DUF1350 family protein [Prochloraceae cyanobacterium]